ncbi:MAG TPA: EamA family transporter [Streptosporangiaceae bacterium]|nr:EamA family transporter [Streptosporangiaceae bacterium]
MRNPRHVLLAIAVVIIWGVNFVVIGVALRGFPPIFLAALRFALTSLAAFFVPRPQVPWRWIAAVGLCTLAGQYGFLFAGLAQGMPEGLSSLVIQSQVPFTVLLAAGLLRERVSVRGIAGIATAGAGLVIISVARGGAVPLGALLLCVASGASWAAGNICTRQAKAENGFALLVWASLFAVPPLVALSLFVEGPRAIGAAATHPHLAPIAALGFIVVVATLIGMGSWVMLLSKNPASAVVPYALGVPVVGLAAAALLHGEHLSGIDFTGVTVVLCGLAVTVMSRSGAVMRTQSRPGAECRHADLSA